MAQPKLKINIFDLLALIILMAVLAILFFPTTSHEGKDKIVVTIKTSQTEVLAEARKDPDVYLNSINKEVRVDAVTEKLDSNGRKYLEIKLSGLGRIENDRYIFEGQRILVGQKAEIHDTYFIQGLVTEVNNAN